MGELGSLLCLSTDYFKTTYWAVIGEANPRLHANGVMFIRFYSEEGEKFYQQVKNGKRFMMIQSPTFFVKFRPVLSSLQRSIMRTEEELEATSFSIPFEEQLVKCIPSNRPARYIAACPPQVVKEITKEVLGEINLDETQEAARLLAMTQSFALIQGPPGTGKTFLALKIANILLRLKKYRDEQITILARKNAKRAKTSGPIMILTYKNHALDQFLIGCLSFTKAIVRVGSRSKSEVLENYNLKALSKKVDRRDIKDHLKSRYKIRGSILKLKKEMALVLEDLEKVYAFKKKDDGLCMKGLTLKVFRAQSDKYQQESLLYDAPDEASEIPTHDARAYLELWLGGKIDDERKKEEKK